MKLGEIYFISERDRKEGTTSSYVKIGMVSDIERGSQERLREHQTGNPRDLELRHVTETPNPFRVEKFLHQRFGSKRIRNEWFDLDDNEIEEAIVVAEKMAQEAFQYQPIIDTAADLGHQISDDTKIIASDDALHWHQKLMAAKEALKVCEGMKSAYLAVATELSPAQREEIEEEELILTESYIQSTFDESGFAEKYPQLFKTFMLTSSSISGRFTPAKLQIELDEIDRDLMAFNTDFLDACEQVRRNVLQFSQLFDLHREFEVFEGAYQWDHEVADAQLRVLCGTAAGIEGICTWKRAEKITSSLDMQGLESYHPDEFNEFRTTELKTRVKTKKRSRKHK